MPSKTLLLALIVREAGLRSSLVARLSMGGADVVTADDFDDPRLARHRKGPLVLVADASAVDGHDGGAEALAADPRWRKLVLLTPGEPQPSGDPRLVRISHKSAAGEIARLLPEWQAGL